MVSPINYMLDVANPMTAALAGYGAGATERTNQQVTEQNMQIAATEEARAAETFQINKAAMEEQRRAGLAAAAQAAEAQRRGGAAMSRLIDLGPTATTKDYLIAINENPSYQAQIKSVMDAYGDDRAQGEIGFGTQLFAALKNNPSVAGNMIEERRAAAENAGDPETVAQMKSLQMMMEQPEGAQTVLALTGATLAGMMGADQFKVMSDALGMGSGESNKELFDQEKQIRKEYIDLTKEVRLVQQAYDRVAASQDTGPGDVSLIFGYMKMLDPMTGIKEGEVALASQTSGIPDTIVNLYNSAVTGERLTPDQRASFKSQAADLLTAAQLTEDRARSSLMPVIKEYGLNPSQIFGAPGEVEDDAAAGAGQTAMPESFTASKAVTDAAAAAGTTPEAMWAIMTPEQRAKYGR